MSLSEEEELLRDSEETKTAVDIHQQDKNDEQTTNTNNEELKEQYNGREKESNESSINEGIISKSKEPSVSESTSTQGKEKIVSRYKVRYIKPKFLSDKQNDHTITTVNLGETATKIYTGTISKQMPNNEGKTMSDNNDGGIKSTGNYDGIQSLETVEKCQRIYDETAQLYGKMRQSMSDFFKIRVLDKKLQQVNKPKISSIIKISTGTDILTEFSEQKLPENDNAKTKEKVNENTPKLSTDVTDKIINSNDETIISKIKDAITVQIYKGSNSKHDYRLNEKVKFEHFYEFLVS